MELTVVPQSVPIFPRQFISIPTTPTTTTTPNNIALNMTEDVLRAMEDMFEASMSDKFIKKDRSDRQLWSFFGTQEQEAKSRQQGNRKRKPGQRPRKNKMTADDALDILRRKETHQQQQQQQHQRQLQQQQQRRQQQKAQESKLHGESVSPSESHQQEAADQPKVVFFPTGPQGSGASGGCQDTLNGGGGFNTFAFLSFLLSAVNAISVISNNINNRRNNNNNNNNDNNNNQFSTLDSSVKTTQTVSRKRRSSSSNDVDDFDGFIDAADFLFENDVPAKMTTIWNAFFSVGSDVDDDDVNQTCDANRSMFPPELVDSFNVTAKLVQAWIQSALVEQDLDCQARIICRANQDLDSMTQKVLAETLSYALITRISEGSELVKANYLLDSVQLGQSNPDAAACKTAYSKCPSVIWNKSWIVSSLFEAPLKLWKMTESYFFPYHWFQKLNQCHQSASKST